jgi:hypothetical protein
LEARLGVPLLVGLWGRSINIDGVHGDNVRLLRYGSKFRGVILDDYSILVLMNAFLGHQICTTYSMSGVMIGVSRVVPGMLTGAGEGSDGESDACIAGRFFT